MTSTDMEYFKAEPTAPNTPSGNNGPEGRRPTDRLPALISGSASHNENDQSTLPRSGFPIDPLRLIGGTWKRKHWIVLGALLGLGAGIGYGLLKAASRFEVSAQIIKQQQPAVLRIGATGEAYRPRQFNNSTLPQAATSMKLLQRVAAKAKPPVSASLLKKSARVTEDRGTDFATMTLSGYTSASATVDLVNLWAAEFVEFSREMQRQESQEMRQLVEKQVASTQTELEAIEARLAEFSREGRLPADLLADGKPRAGIDVVEKSELARAQLATLEAKLESLRNGLSRQSPQAEEIRAARNELEQYRSRYTDRNPLVLERIDRLAALQAESKQLADAIVSDPSKAGALTGAANETYSKIVELEGERDTLKRQIEALEKMRQQAAQSPQEALQIADLLQSRADLKAAQSSLRGRLQEVRLFEESAPGYYNLFTPATLERVIERSKALKMSVFCLVGLAGGSVCGLLLALFGAVADPKLSTSAEAAAVMGAPLLASIPSHGEPDKMAEIGGRLWVRWIGGRAQVKQPRAVWAPAPGEGEEAFWQLLLSQAQKLSPSVLIIDCGSTPAPALAALPQASLHTAESLTALAAMRFPVDEHDLSETTAFAELINRRTAAGRDVWLRFAGPVQEPSARLARSAQLPLLVVPLQTHNTTFWREQSELLRHSVGAPCGVVVTNETSVFSRS